MVHGRSGEGTAAWADAPGVAAKYQRTVNNKMEYLTFNTFRIGIFRTSHNGGSTPLPEAGH
jgi:hypothetical protein